LGVVDTTSPIQSQINNLVNTKASQADVNLLNTRVNNIIANAGDDNTEIVDARVGTDGTTYTVLKDRLDTEHTQLKSALSDIEDFVYYDKNYLDVTDDAQGSYESINNGDGTYTFKTTDYGTAYWKSLEDVPPGEYKMNGTAGFGFFAVSTDGAYSGSTVIAINSTQNEIIFTNSIKQTLYIVLRCNGAPSSDFTVTPFIKSKVKKDYATIETVNEIVGGELIAFKPGYIVTNGPTVDVDTVKKSSTFKYAVIDCSQGDYFTIEATGTQEARAWCFIDAQGNNLLRSEKDESVNTILRAPVNAVKLVINNNTDTVSYKGLVLRNGVSQNYNVIQKMIDDGLYYDKNYIDVFTKPTGSYSDIISNDDGTYTCTTTRSGTATWKSINKVPKGRYRLSGLIGGSRYNFFAVSTDGAYSGSTVIATNNQFDEISFDNPEDQVLYLTLRLNGRPSKEFVISPGVRKYIIPEAVLKKQGNPGQILEVNEEGNIVPGDIIDSTLSVSGKAADAKQTGDCINDLRKTHSNYKRTCEIYAHQGFDSNGARLNTITALLEAQKAGCDGMETDVRQTSDGKYVIWHDLAISGTIDGASVTKKISESPLAELKKILITTSSVYGDIYISTLDELLQAAAYTGMKMLLELKAGYAEDMAKAVMRTGMQGRVTYMCSPNHWAAIQSIDKHADFAEVIFGLGTVSDFTKYAPYLNSGNSVSIDYQANASLGESAIANMIAAQEVGLHIDFWNLSNESLNLLDINPKHTTINGSDMIPSIDSYIAQKKPY